MPKPMPEYDDAEQALNDTLGAPASGQHPSLELLRAAGQDVLPPEIEARVAQHLRDCGLCAMLLEDFATLDAPELTAVQQQRIAQTLPVDAAIPMAPRRRSIVPLFGSIAALLVIGFGALHFRGQNDVAPARVQTPPPTSAVAELQIPLEALALPGNDAAALQTRGGSAHAPSTEALIPAFTAYRQGDYAAAVQRFQPLAVQYPSSNLVALYLGVSQLLNRQDAAAYATLAHARALDPKSDTAQWYGAIAAQRNHAPGAKAMLDDLCHQPRSAYSGRACKLAAGVR